MAKISAALVSCTCLSNWSHFLSLAASNGARPKVLTSLRQAIDPSRYTTIESGNSEKYACSTCGKIYKWKKSLNKHWKDKHGLTQSQAMHVQIPQQPHYHINSRTREYPLTHDASRMIVKRHSLYPNLYSRSHHSKPSAFSPRVPSNAELSPHVKHAASASSSGSDGNAAAEVLRKPPPAHIGELKHHKLAAFESDAGIDLTQSTLPDEGGGSNGAILDLSMKGVAEMEAREQSQLPPPQNQPLDFSSHKQDNDSDSFPHPSNFAPTPRLAMDSGSPLQCPSRACTSHSKFVYDEHMEMHLKPSSAECQQRNSSSSSPEIDPDKYAFMVALRLEATSRVKKLQQRKKVAPPVSIVLPMMQNIKWLPNKLSSRKRASYKCAQCAYVTDNSTTFEKHVRMHNTPNRYRCEWCNWSTGRLHLLYRHAQSVHPDDLASEEKESFYNQVRGRSHSEGSSKNGSRESTPSNTVPYTNPGSPLLGCGEVPKTGRQTGGIRARVPMRKSAPPASAVHAAEDSPIGKRGNSTCGKRKRKIKCCPKCSYVTDNVTTLNRHVSKHGSNGRFRCKHCDYSVSRQHIIKQHLKNVHGEEEGVSQPRKRLNTGGVDIADDDAASSAEVKLQ